MNVNFYKFTFVSSERLTTDDLMLHVIDAQGYWVVKPSGKERKGFMLNVNYRDVMDAIDAVIPFQGGGDYKKSAEVMRKMMFSVILTRHLSEAVKLKRVAQLLNVSSHALIVHYRKQHDKKLSSTCLDDTSYRNGFYVALDMLCFQSDKNKQRIDNLLAGCVI